MVETHAVVERQIAARLPRVLHEEVDVRVDGIFLFDVLHLLEPRQRAGQYVGRTVIGVEDAGAHAEIVGAAIAAIGDRIHFVLVVADVLAAELDDVRSADPRDAARELMLVVDRDRGHARKREVGISGVCHRGQNVVCRLVNRGQAAQSVLRLGIAVRVGGQPLHLVEVPRVQHIQHHVRRERMRQVGG
jgi:hypothetical protein